MGRRHIYGHGHIDISIIIVAILFLYSITCSSASAGISCSTAGYEYHYPFEWTQGVCDLHGCFEYSMYSNANNIKWGNLEINSDTHPYVLTSEGFWFDYSCRGDGEWTIFRWDGQSVGQDNLTGRILVTNTPTNRVTLPTRECQTYNVPPPDDCWTKIDRDEFSPSYNSGSKYVHVIRCYQDSDCGGAIAVTRMQAWDTLQNGIVRHFQPYQAKF
jgi:hypothetical protein